jgi:hypothetical protein
MSLLASLGRFAANNPLMLLADFGPQAVKAWFWFFDYVLYDGDPPDRDGELDEDDDAGLWRYEVFAQIDRLAAEQRTRGA